MNTPIENLAPLSPEESDVGTASKLEPFRSRERTYSAPRKFDMATMFVVTIVYSLVLGGMTAIGLSDIVIVCIVGVFTAVGAAQALLFGGMRPRWASQIAGGVSIASIVLFALLFDGLPAGYAVAGSVLSIPVGVFLGYLFGALVGGVFLVADYLRNGRGVLE